MKAFLLLADKTQSVVEALDGNVGGIQILPCSYVTKLEKAIVSAGTVNKIIIFENAIDTPDHSLPEILKNSVYNVILVLKTPELMQKYDIIYMTNNNIQIVDLKGEKVTTKLIRELVSATEVDAWRLYKAEALAAEVPQPQQPVEEMQPQMPTEEVPQQGRRNVRQESGSLFDDLSDNLLVNTPIDDNIGLNEGPKRQVSLATEVKPMPQSFNTVEVTPEKKINQILNLYTEGCILAFMGTPKSFTTTTAYDIAMTFADAGATTCLIDLDTDNYGLGYLNKEIYRQTNQAKDMHRIENALKDKKLIPHCIKHSDNLFVLTNSILLDGFRIEESWVKLLRETLLENRTKFKVIILNMQLTDVNYFKDIIKMCAKVIFNIPMTNKDYLVFAKSLLEVKDEELRERLFKNSAYISVSAAIGQGTNVKKTMLNTDVGDLTAIDMFLQNEFNLVQSDRMFGSIPQIGNIIEDIAKTDALMNPAKINFKEMQKLVLRLFTNEDV